MRGRNCQIDAICSRYLLGNKMRADGLPDIQPRRESAHFHYPYSEYDQSDSGFTRTISSEERKLIDDIYTTYLVWKKRVSKKNYKDKKQKESFLCQYEKMIQELPGYNLAQLTQIKKLLDFMDEDFTNPEGYTWIASRIFTRENLSFSDPNDLYNELYQAHFQQTECCVLDGDCTKCCSRGYRFIRSLFPSGGLKAQEAHLNHYVCPTVLFRLLGNALTYTFYTYGALAFFIAVDVISEVIKGTAQITMAQALFRILIPSPEGLLLTFVIGSCVAIGKSGLPRKVCDSAAWIAGCFMCFNRKLENAGYLRGFKKILRRDVPKVVDI